MYIAGLNWATSGDSMSIAASHALLNTDVCDLTSNTNVMHLADILRAVLQLYSSDNSLLRIT